MDARCLLLDDVAPRLCVLLNGTRSIVIRVATLEEEEEEEVPAL